MSKGFTTAGAPSLSVIIVNYKSARLIADCLESLEAQTPDLQYEVIVVDNASDDGSEALLTARFPGIRYHQMGYNSGFSRANNAGIRMARAAAVLLLNPDTIILDKAVQRCFADFSGDSGYVACGVQLLEEDGRPQISGSFNMKGGINTLLPLPYWGSFLRWLGYKLQSRIPNVPEATAKTDVDWINGAYLMVSMAAIDQAGMMDEDFFLFSEEIEWCSRLRKHGKLCIYGQHRVIHLQGETTKHSFNSADKGYYNLYDKKGLQIMVSSFLRVRKQFGLAWFLFMLLNYLIAVPVSFVCALPLLFYHPAAWVSRMKLFGGFYLNMLIFLYRYSWRIVMKKKYFYKVI